MPGVFPGNAVPVFFDMPLNCQGHIADRMRQYRSPDPHPQGFFRDFEEAGDHRRRFPHHIRPGRVPDEALIVTAGIQPNHIPFFENAVFARDAVNQFVVDAGVSSWLMLAVMVAGKSGAFCFWTPRKAGVAP